MKLICGSKPMLRIEAKKHREYGPSEAEATMVQTKIQMEAFYRMLEQFRKETSEWILYGRPLRLRGEQK